MKRIEETMTLGEFISAMQAGWMFRRGGGRVQRIGDELARIFPLESLPTPVTVTYISSNYGSGPSFHYTFDWEVAGSLPQVLGGTLPPNDIDRAFGFLAGNLPELRVTPSGFSVGFEW